jgi:hypothetical protein
MDTTLTLSVPHAPPLEPGKFVFRAASGLVVEVLHVLDGHVALIA